MLDTAGAHGMQNRVWVVRPPGLKVVDLVLSPDKKHLVVAASSLNVSSSEVDQDTCMLTGTSTSSATGETVTPVALSTLELGGNNFVYTGNVVDAVFRPFELMRRIFV